MARTRPWLKAAMAVRGATSGPIGRRAARTGPRPPGKRVRTGGSWCAADRPGAGGPPRFDRMRVRSCGAHRRPRCLRIHFRMDHSPRVLIALIAAVSVLFEQRGMDLWRGGLCGMNASRGIRWGVLLRVRAPYLVVLSGLKGPRHRARRALWRRAQALLPADRLTATTDTRPLLSSAAR